ncbi:MAG: serine hydrolase domain-containing protein [Bacteroidia bacterium]|nr:serine hydrolase domain-containing protein [Bacteroidia bacterium]
MNKHKFQLRNLLILCLLFFCKAGWGQEVLRKGFIEKKKLHPGETHEYKISLEEGMFFFASSMSYEFDIIVSVQDPSGTEVDVFDDNGIAGEFIPIHAESSGEYKILISPFPKEKKSGYYELEVIKLQASAKSKVAKVEELFSFWEGTKGEESPGLAIAIVQDGKCVYQKAYGLANLEYQIPLSSKSVFDLASLAKQFTGMAIAMLIEEGKLKLEDDIRKHIPELPIFDQVITIEDLLHHKSGLRGVGGLFSMGVFKSGEGYGEQATADLVLEALNFQKELNFPVGEEHSYSNTGYILLAIAVERVTGESYRDWMQLNIFDPLEMEFSFANDNPDEIIKNRATAYYFQDGKLAYRQENGMALIGSSAVYSTTDDLVKWVLNFEKKKVGNSRVFQLMERKSELNNGEEINYGFGQNLISYKGLRMIEHSGYTHPGFQTNIARFPDQKFSLIVLSNWGDLNPVDVISRHIPPIFLDEYIEKEESPEESPVEDREEEELILSQEILERYTGSFQFNQEETVVFRIEEGKLTAEPSGQGTHTLKVLSEHEFHLQALNVRISFSEFAEGKAQKAIVSRGEDLLSEMERIEPVEGADVFDPEKISLDEFSGYYYSPELRILYQLILEEDILYLSAPNIGNIELSLDSEDIFNSPSAFLSECRFLRDEEKQIKGFRLSQGPRTRNVLFEKWE